MDDEIILDWFCEPWIQRSQRVRDFFVTQWLLMMIKVSSDMDTIITWNCFMAPPICWTENEDDLLLSN